MAPQFRRVTLKDPNRGGLLGQGSILTVTSYPNRTSVVQRGKWVLENLLGTPPPPPPPDIPALKPNAKDGQALTMRQQMEQHRANPVCAGCHSRMDPIGFALENYNGVGAWRAKDAGNPDRCHRQIAGRHTFRRPGGLKKLLLTRHRDEFISTFTEKLMTYALGRGLEYYDMPAMRAIIRERPRQNTTIPALITAVVKSPQFQMRRTRPMIITKKASASPHISARPRNDPGAAPAGRHGAGIGGDSDRCQRNRRSASAFVYVPNGIIPEGMASVQGGPVRDLLRP